MRFRVLVLSLLFLMSLAGCGYRLAARKGDVGRGQTIAVPTFINSTYTYRIEQRMSESVRKELARRTHYRVTSGEMGDVVLRGEVLGYNTSPTVFDPSGRAAQYALGLTLKVSITDRATGKVLFENGSLTLRETFQLSENAGDFVPEDPAAVDRLASSFASAVVASLVHRQ
jgi:outer membrane lipopolysaccharide assembly protein LptE/RlpB